MIQFLKTKGIAILGVLLVMSMFLFSVIQRPLANSVYNKLVVTSEYYTSPYFNAGNGYELYFDDSTPISVAWLLDNPDYSVKVGFSTYETAIVIGQHKLYGLTGATLSSSYFKNMFELEPERWKGILESNEPICLTITSGSGFATAQSFGEALSPFQKVLQVIAHVGESMFTLAGSAVSFILKYPILLIGLLISLVGSGVLLLKVFTKGV